MYKHLLVPIDESWLSNATVEQAVAYASAGQARLTFFHSRTDYAATGEGALLHSAAPAVFAEAAAGNAHAILAKAEAAARAAGVACASRVCTSDKPHEAILDAARTSGCDLIFMASRGRRGLKGALLGSVTNKVLQRTTMPVLVATVASNLLFTDEQRALATIKDEHRSLAAVTQALLRVVGDAEKSGRKPDVKLLRAMLYYIEHFPERLHHPKEDEFLFRKLRGRTSDCDALIAELEQQHADGTACFEDLRAKLGALEADVVDSLREFATAARAYAEMYRKHMGAEERLIFPAASRYLCADDWREIACAFSENGDPRFGADVDESFEDLISKLLNLASGAA